MPNDFLRAVVGTDAQAEFRVSAGVPPPVVEDSRNADEAIVGVPSARAVPLAS